ncbi:MAG: Ig-like domain-containing protein [Bacteroidales bacterium]|nr:Ig-like domain-containing protein [Bacteroidales bacterium]
MQAKQIFNLTVSVFVSFLIVVSCANPVAPTGGPKDETPPEFLGSDPVNRSRNFNTDRIDLAFDEFVVLEDLNQQLLISPPMKEKLDVKTKGKGVRIDFDKEESLAENTTYTIYFGDAIVDLHEKNPLSNFQYVFSTGADIDSLSIRGKVLSAEYLLPATDVFVCLYLDNNDTIVFDSMPQKVRPYYVAKTNEEGTFEINNIKNDHYLIFAVKDANANYFNDMPNEAIAFALDLIKPEEVFDYIPDTIPVDTSNVKLMDSLWANYAIQITKETHTLLLYEPQDSVQKIIADEFLDNKRMHFEFKYPLKEDVAFEILNQDTDKEVFLAEYSANRDSLDLWFLKPFSDTLRFSMVADTLKVDTLEIVFNDGNEKEIPKTRRGRKEDKSQKLKVETIGYTSNFKKDFPFFAKGKIIFESPIKLANFENCTLLEDSIPVPFEIYFTDKVKRKLVIDYSWKEGADYRFEIPDQALTDIYGLKNDSIVENFNTTEESQYAELILHIILPEESSSSWIVQLFKGEEDKEQIVDFSSIKKSGDLTFSKLSANKYRVKVLEDCDNNGRWTSGDYTKKQLPEKVFYFPTPIELKAGWKVEETWTVDDAFQVNPSVKIKKK